MREFRAISVDTSCAHLDSEDQTSPVRVDMGDPFNMLGTCDAREKQPMLNSSRFWGGSVSEGRGNVSEGGEGA